MSQELFMRYVTAVSCSIMMIVMVVLGGLSSPIFAQDASDGDFEAFQDHLQRDYFTVGALLQTVGDYQYDRVAGENGFFIGNARLQVKGILDDTFGYQLQASFLSNPAVLDANVYYNITSDFSVKAGLFKAPFSYEYLTGAAAIDFVNRSTVVNQLAPKRQIGLQLQGNVAEGKLKYSAGMFNGNGFGDNRNDDGKFLYTARLEANSGFGNSDANNFMAGVNASYEQNDLPSDGNVYPDVPGDNVLLGVDTRINYEKLMLAGEFIYSSMDPETAPEYNPYGYYATAGYFVTSKMQLLARWDYFDGDFIRGSSESIVGGINIFPTAYSEVQLNYSYPINDGIDFSQVLVNLQIGL